MICGGMSKLDEIFGLIKKLFSYLKLLVLYYREKLGVLAYVRPVLERTRLKGVNLGE